MRPWGGLFVVVEKCVRTVELEQHSVIKSCTGKTERNPSDEANHSADNPNVSNVSDLLVKPKSGTYI